MRDPIGICSRIGRPNTAQAQSDRHRDPRLGEYAIAQSPYSQVRVSLHPSPRASDKFRKPSVSLGLDRGNSLSTVEIKDTETQESRSHRTANEYEESLPNARHPRVASLRSFFESISEQGLKAPGSQSPPDLSPTKQAHLCAKKELGWKSIDEQHAVVVQTARTLQNHEKRPEGEAISDSAGDGSVVHAADSNSNLAAKQNIHGAECDNNSKNEPPVKRPEKLPDPPIESGKELGVSLGSVLPIRTRAQILSRKSLQMTPYSSRVKKRIIEREDEGLEIVVSKKTYRRAKITTTFAQSAIVMETTKTLRSDLLFKPMPSRFLESKHPNIDKSAFEFVSSVKTTSCDSPFAHLLEAQPEFGFETQQTDANPVPFVSALETFNAIIPGCDAMRRFETMHSERWRSFRCLTDTKAERGSIGRKWSGRKCNGRLERADRDLIRRLLLQLDETNIYTDGEECINVFGVLASQAICHHHEALARMLFKHRIRELLERRVQEQETTRKPITLTSDSNFGIGWWLRPAPHGALHYIPEYRPFSNPGSVSEKVNQFIRDQARQPLVTEATRSTDRFTEHDGTRDGYLYVYWNRASFGHLKIGFTGNNVDRRLHDWEEQCQHIAEKQYQSPRKIKHAARVEKLIHTEFANHRVSEPACHGCGKEHIEWFRDLDLRLVIQRIEAWSQWINECPYEYTRGAWRLKEDPEYGLPLPSAIQTTAPQTPKKPRTPRSKSSSPRQSSRPQPAREKYPSPQPRTRPTSLFTLLAAQVQPAVSAANVMHTFSAPILK